MITVELINGYKLYYHGKIEMSYGHGFIWIHADIITDHCGINVFDAHFPEDVVSIYESEREEDIPETHV